MRNPIVTDDTEMLSSDIKSEYKAKLILNPNSSKSSKDIKFTAPPFDVFENGHQRIPLSGRTALELLASYYYTVRGFDVKPISKTYLLKDSNKFSRAVVEEKIDPDKNIEDICVAGIPDLLVFEKAGWAELGRFLPRIKNIDWEDKYDRTEISIGTSKSTFDPIELVNEHTVRFVEVKNKYDKLNKNQREWFAKNDEIRSHVLRFSEDVYQNKSYTDGGR